MELLSLLLLLLLSLLLLMLLSLLPLLSLLLSLLFIFPTAAEKVMTRSYGRQQAHRQKLVKNRIARQRLMKASRGSHLGGRGGRGGAYSQARPGPMRQKSLRFARSPSSGKTRGRKMPAIPDVS